MRKFTLVTILLLSVLIMGCVVQSIEEIKSEENIGERVVVLGTVSESVKIGGLSGYLLEDNGGDIIGVFSSKIPQEGEKITVRGTLMRDTVFGYYIKE